MTIYGLTGERLPCHSQPLPGELLTHWVFRLAAENGLKAQAMADLLLGKRSPYWARDQDRNPTEKAITQLAILTGQEERSITDLSLRSYEGLFCTGDIGTRIASWILPLGIYHRTRKGFGVQYCPLCLAEDPVPYFRRKWRLAFYTFCDRHGSMLHDRCYQCGSPVIWVRNDIGHWRTNTSSETWVCWNCKADLRRAPAYAPLAIDGYSSMQLRAQLALCDIGWWFVDSGPLHYSHEYFDVLRHLVMWLVRRNGEAVLAKVTPNTWEGSYTKDNEFEKRSIDERHRLISLAHWLLDGWPDRFIRICQSVGLKQGYLLTEGELPYWFESVVRQELSEKRYIVTREEVASAADYMRKHEQPVTRVGLSKLVGNRDNRRVIEAIPSETDRLSEEAFKQLIIRLSQRKRTLHPGSIARCLVFRDQVMFLLARYLDKKPLLVRRMTIDDGYKILLSYKPTTAFSRKVCSFLRLYIGYGRGRLKGGNLLFPAQYGRRVLGSEGWRVRWRNAIRML